MTLISRNKAWPTLTAGLFEMCVVNIYIVKRQDKRYKENAGEFRWSIVNGMVEKAKQLEEAPGTCDELEYERVTATGDADMVPRFEGVDTHHWELLDEYVTPEQAEINSEIVRQNPSGKQLHRRPRKRDQHRQDGKVRNPLWTSASVCLVCKYQYLSLIHI